MKRLIILLLFASPLFAQDQIIDHYFPEGISENTIWVFERRYDACADTIILTKGHYWNLSRVDYYLYTPEEPPLFNFSILGNNIVWQSHEFNWDQYTIIADFDLKQGYSFDWDIIIAGQDSGIPNVFLDHAECISTDTTVVTQFDTLGRCYLFFFEGLINPFMELGTYHNMRGSFLYYAPHIGFASKYLVYAKIGEREFGQLPDGVTKNDLIPPITSVPIVKEQILGSFTLAQNYPNPFNSETVIEFNLPQFSEIELAVYDVSGREIKTILSGQLPPGAYSEKWNGTDNSGNAVASGVYFIRLQSGQYSKFIKAVYNK